MKVLVNSTSKELTISGLMVYPYEERIVPEDVKVVKAHLPSGVKLVEKKKKSPKRKSKKK